MKKKTQDEAFLERLKAEAPEVVEAEVNFDAGIVRVMRAKLTQEKKVTPKKKRTP